MDRSTLDFIVRRLVTYWGHFLRMGIITNMTMEERHKGKKKDDKEKYGRVSGRKLHEKERTWTNA